MLASFTRSYVTQFEWFWYLWPEMAYKMSQEFPIVSLDITHKLWNERTLSTQLRDQTFGNEACVGWVYAAEFTPGVPYLCWKSSHSVFLKTLNFLLVWTSFLAFSFCCVCSLYVWMSSPKTLNEVPLNVVEIPVNHIHQKKNVFFHIHEVNMGSCVVY